MRSTLLPGAVITTAIIGCSPGVQVRTAVAFDADLAGLRTFYMLTPPGPT